MNTPKILVISTYPIRNPQHGGQKRTYAIVEEYEKAFSRVRHCAVYYRGFYSHSDADDIALGRQSEQKVMQSPLTGDVVIGHAIYDDPEVRQKLTSLLQDFQPDIIHIEQPFPYLGLKPLLADLSMSPKLIFGSQNIEAPMKREILEGAGVSEDAIRTIEDEIHKLEVMLTRDSDLVVACTPSDLATHKKMGATNLVLAQNGIARITTSPAAQAYWQQKFQNMGVARTALFVGSAHPPNWTGFLQMVGKGLGFIGHDSRIVIAGSISDYFEREITEGSLSIEDATFWLRAYSAGRLSEEKLGALITLSDVMLLPITEGGGSNLKTAEAILADKKVIATEHALRSFEWFRTFPNVWVASTQQEFQDAITEALASDSVRRTPEQQKKADTVEWKYCLAEMVLKVGKL